MKYFKNVEAATIYHVSEKAVRNWIAATRSGKLDLELHEKNGKYYLANTTKNQTVIRQLVERGQKYKNGRSVVTVSPKADFYKLYGPEQIFDILSNLDIHREIPLQYSYFVSGAKHWDSYAQRLFDEREANTLKATIQLLGSCFTYLETILDSCAGVNVIDLGVGNALPVRELLSRLTEKKLLRRYIGVDISEEMLKIANHNVSSWFGDKFNHEWYLKDLNYDHFAHVVAEDAFNNDGKRVINIVLLLGGTLSNMPSPSRVLRLINDSMNKNDIFIHTLKLDSVNSRRYFNFNVRNDMKKLDPIFRTVIDALDISELHYEVEQLFDEKKKMRFMRIKLDQDLNLEFKIGETLKNIQLKKGEQITVGRVRHQSALDVVNELESNGFDLLQATKTPDQEYLLTISKVKTDLPDSSI